MPYIAVHTERSLGAPEKESLKAALGQAITVIPGKKEKGLMVEICDGCDLYYGGQKCDAAYLDVKIFRHRPAGRSKSLYRSRIPGHGRCGV